MRFRHPLHRKSPVLGRIIKGIKRDGYYYFDGQKRKPDNVRKQDEMLIIEGEVISL